MQVRSRARSRAAQERRPCGQLLPSGCAPARRPCLTIARHRKLRVSGYGLSEAYRGPAHPLSTHGSACTRVRVRSVLCALVCVDPRQTRLEGRSPAISPRRSFKGCSSKFRVARGESFGEAWYKDFLKLIIESMSRKGLPFSTSRKFACTARAYRRA